MGTVWSHKYEPPRVVNRVQLGEGIIIARRVLGQDHYRCIIFKGCGFPEPYVLADVWREHGAWAVPSNNFYTNNLSRVWYEWLNDKPAAEIVSDRVNELDTMAAMLVWEEARSQFVGQHQDGNKFPITDYFENALDMHKAGDL